MTEFTNGDKDIEQAIFLTAMEDVKPLKQSNKVSFEADKKKPKPKKYRQKSQSNYDSDLDYTADSKAVSAFQSLYFQRSGLRPQEVQKLRKGEFAIQAQLDLHGLTEEAADISLQNFIHRVFQQKTRYALVVHGKGYNSDENYPVLKNLVNRRLKQLKPVLAFCSAQPKDGGTGAVYVFLKAQN